MDALTALAVKGAVKQQPLQNANDVGIFFGLHDDGAVHPLATQIRVSVVVLIGVDAVAAIRADFVDDAADAHDLVSVVVHFNDKQRRFIRNVAPDGNGRLVNAGIIRICGAPCTALGQGCIVVSGDAHCECLGECRIGFGHD